MMHIVFPNVHPEGKFLGCVRCLSLPPAQAPGPPSVPTPAIPRTNNLVAVHMAVETLLPEWPERMVREDAAQIYQITDGAGEWKGTSLDFTYLLALVRCVRTLVLEQLTDV